MFDQIRKLLPEQSLIKDKELFNRIAVGDEQAFEEIFHSYNSRLFHTVLKLVKSEEETEEIIQETFLRVWLNRSGLNDIDVPGAWIHTIAANIAVSHLRKIAVKKRSLRVVNDGGFDSPYEPLEIIETKEVQNMIDEAVHQLPPSRREVFVLSRRAGMSRKEIAEKMQISESTVKNQLNAALKFIQNHLEKSGGLHLPILLISLFLKIK